MAAHPELLRLEAERQADQLRQVEDREPEVAADHLRRLRLLKVEVQVAERARRHQAVGAGVDRVADVRAGLGQRRLPVHRDHREAAALARAVVVDDLAADGVDHLLEVEVALGVVVVAQPRLRPQDVAAVERADAEPGERPLHLLAQGLEADVLDQEPEEVLVGEPVLARDVLEALAGERLVDVPAIGGVRVEPLLALRLRALAGRADVHHREARSAGRARRCGRSACRPAPGCARRSPRRRSSWRGRG